VGVESLSEEALKVFNKGVSVEQILQAMDVLRELGINCKFGFIFFHPWTTINEIKTNISQLKSIIKGDTFYLYHPFYSVNHLDTHPYPV